MSSCVHVPLTTQRAPFGVAVLGGPTTVVDIGGYRLICDPTFDPPGDYGYLQKLTGPAVDETVVGDVDVALVSHDLHYDNLDISGRAFALAAPVLLTTPTAAPRLGGPSKPLAPWTTWVSPGGGLEVTAVPARHGPADGELNEEGFVNCEVIGFVVSATDGPRVYISGDNTAIAIVREIRERVGDIDCAVLFAGSASVPAKFDGRPLSLTAERAAAAAEVLDAPHVVVAHQDGWRHFRQGPADTVAAFHAGGITERLCGAPLGQMCNPSHRPAATA
ncbi:MBL fold metallo-hydrolase [Mycolicibacterium neworleansense]|uniref:Zn-dependent hydrolase of beta-lactamase fold protein n=1 Tax=Mycolicibacterium neworleansense TaxID=146018 RepID=A0A0H5SAX1_9MYCO|nr:MBL fold metallo-hydrolase [Mycolicibacterium neworleansense]MCV7362811.1 MBL fold metallo-hydrolase [Mycolicibacterium neworleansense]CRZ18549.1 Zn-dependent hydrolase of beta-lactamase fold protein [Mycolicibacterium neworleansense]